LKYQHSTTIETYFAATIENDLPNTKRFYKWIRKQLKNVSPLYLREVLEKKTWLLTTESIDHSYYRTLMKALKTA